MSEPQSTVEFSGAAMTLSQAAAALGISEKTLRKRIHAGEIQGEKTALEGGGTAWRVYLEGERAGTVPEVAPEAERNFTVPRAGSAPEVFHSQNERNGSGTVNAPEARRNIAPEVTGTRAGSETVSAPEVLQGGRTVDFLRDALEREREQTAFLRAQIEGHARAEAELRAALREALRAMPRQLSERSTVEFDRTQQTARIARDGANSGETGKVSGGAGNVGHAQPRREPRPLWKLLLGVR